MLNLKLFEKMNDLSELNDTLINRPSITDINELCEKLKECLVLLTNIYHKPDFSKFDLEKFRINKTRLFMVCNNILEIQQSLILNKDYIELCEIYLNKIYNENNNYLSYICILNEILININKMKFYTLLELRDIFIDVLKNEVLYSTRANIQKLESELDYRADGLDSRLDSILDLHYTDDEYTELLRNLYVESINDINGLINRYPEYFKQYIQLENNICQSIFYLFFNEQAKYQKLIFPNELVEFITFKEFPNENFRLWEKEKTSFIKNIISKVMKILPFKSYTKKDNIKFLRRD